MLSTNCVTTNHEINFYNLFYTELNEFILYTAGLDRANFTINQINFWLNENKSKYTKLIQGSSYCIGNVFI